MGRRDTYFGDCKSPYSAPANCKFARTGLRDRYDPTNPQHASYIEGDLMTMSPPRENAVNPFIRIINCNKLTPEESNTILINKHNKEPQ
jgi:hypothetical protein